jgi:CRP-like cAMP-binding protein
MTTTITIVPASKQEIASLLDNTSWTHELSWRQLIVLAGYFQLCHAPAKHIIYQEGGAGDAMGILIKGSAKVTKDGIQLAQLRPGRTFGEMSILDKECRSATVTTLEECEFLAITRDYFDKLSAEQPAVALLVVLKIARLLSQALRQTSGKLSELLD